MSQPLKVLIVEDDWAVREAVHDYLIRHGMVVSEADSLEAALTIAQDFQPDVAVVDIVFPERGGELADFGQHMGIRVARQLRERFPPMGIVFLSAYMDRGPEVIRLFLDGHDRIVYLLKGSKPQELLDAIHKVTKGLSALEIAAGVQTTHKIGFDLAMEMLTEEEKAYVTTALECLETLREPEWRVFESIGSCRVRQQAASELKLSTSTISTHMDAIYDKLHLREKNSKLNQLMLLAKIHLLHRLRQAETDSQT